MYKNTGCPNVSERDPNNKNICIDKQQNYTQYPAFYKPKKHSTENQWTIIPWIPKND